MHDLQELLMPGLQDCMGTKGSILFLDRSTQRPANIILNITKSLIGKNVTLNLKDPKLYSYYDIYVVYSYIVP